MPFWATDRLTDAELLDVVAYVEGSDAPDDDEPDETVLDVHPRRLTSRCAA